MNTDKLLAAAQRAFENDDLKQAAGILQQCLDADQSQPLVATNLCLVLSRLGEFEQAKSVGSIALSLTPKSIPALVNTAVAHRALREFPQAEHYLRKASDLAPGNGEVWDCFSLLYQDQGKLHAAQEASRRAIAAEPGRANSLVNYALLLQKLGKSEAAYRWAGKALKLAPQSLLVAQNFLMLGQYVTAGNSATEVKNTQRVMSHALQSVRQVAMPSSTDRPLRIGFISADFYKHPVGYFLIGVFRELRKKHVEIVMFMNQQHQDELSESLKSAACKVVDISALPDMAVVEIIQEEALSCLIDLSGHSKGNRLAVLAHKPCAKQFSWLGYFATTGMAEIDAVIMGESQYVTGMESYFSEPLALMAGSHFTYTPPDACPDIKPASALKSEGVTFGSFNNLAKFNENLLDVWSQILQSVANSRLVLKWSSFADPLVAEDITSAFTHRGVNANAIECRPASDHYAMLNEYNDIDICLDPFPFNGGLTTCEALWMGVPVITQAGIKPVSRQTKGILDVIGLSDLAAVTPGDYVKQAVALAANEERRVTLRNSLRQMIAQSPLMDYETMASELLAIVNSTRSDWLHSTTTDRT